MVEGRLLPGPFVVALFTFRALLTLMLVVFFVAGVAAQRGVLITIIGVTVSTGDARMFPAERVAGLVVVEPNVLPGIFCMTINAILSDTTLVFVVLLMAGVARGGGLPIFLFWFMAGFAVRFFGIRVSPTEEKVRLGVIESPFVYRGNVFSPPSVLGVAFFTFLLFLQPPVES